jgi:hypothetical protein
MKQLKWSALFITAWACLLQCVPASAQINVVTQRMETDGSTMGFDQQGYYLYLADGERGLKIVNVSNRRFFVLTGTLQLPGSVTKVAVDSRDVAVLTDAADRQVHFVDVADKMRPALMSTLVATGGVPRLVRKIPGKAFVVQYDDDLSIAGAFSGVEIFSHWPRAESVQLVPIAGLRDIVVTQTHLLAAAGNRLLAFRRTASGIAERPETTLDLAATDAVQSLACSGQYLFAFGAENLSVILLPLRPLIPMPRTPGLRLGPAGERIPGKRPPEPAPIELTMVARAPVDTDSDNRKVDAAVIDYKAGMTSDPLIWILLTTQRTYGLFAFNRSTNELEPLRYEDLELSEEIVFKDIHAATEGRISIYDAAFSRYQHPGVFKGGIVALGALGENGLGYVYYEF